MLRITKLETNEIAGELITYRVVLKRVRTLHRAYEYVEKTWGSNPPRDVRIIDEQDGTEFGPKCTWCFNG